MSKLEKILSRLLLTPKPKNFTWAELVYIMKQHNFEIINAKSDGSGRKFIHRQTNICVNLHEPHPENTMKKYALEAAIEGLINSGELSDFDGDENE